ncbi:hypothetical protein GGF32_002499 [Allomyces javanicus]|nr:hypothetical protein GGF32_002499 [Allomyces javanicus]
MATLARPANHDDAPAPDDLQRQPNNTLPAIQQPDLLVHIFAHINDVPTLFHASHVCRSWQTAAQTPSLWARLYRRLNRRCPAPPLHPEADGTILRGYLLESALRDRHAWSGLKRLGTRLKHADGLFKDDVPVEDLHVVRKYARVGTVVAQCPHLLGEPAEGGEKLMKVTDTVVVFEPRLVGNLRNLRTRTFVQVQPLIDPARATPSTPTTPPALLLSSSRERVETFAEDGTIMTSKDTYFHSAGSTASRWAYTQSASRVSLYPLTSLRARITIAPPVPQCHVIAVSCSDDWLAITYHVPLTWVAEHVNDDEESNLPYLLSVWDLRAVRWPHLGGDRCLLLDPADIGITRINVWVPFAHNLVHAVSDANDPFPVVSDATEPWPSPVRSSRRLLKVVVAERGDARRAVTGHRLVTVTFDITAAGAEMIAWQPYYVVPQRTRNGDGTARELCCDIVAWRLFGRILVGVPRDPACCPRVQFARDDSGVGTTTAIDAGLKTVLTTPGRAAFDAVTVLLRPLLRALRRAVAHDADTAMIPVDPTRAALLLPMRRVNDADALTDPAVLRPIRAAMRIPKDKGAGEGMVRRVYAPGTVLAAAAGREGIVLVRSLGPLRGSVVEVCRYGKEKRHGGAVGVKVDVPKVGLPVWIRDSWSSCWPEEEKQGTVEVEEKVEEGTTRMQVKRQAKADGRRKRRGGRGGGAPGVAAGARKSAGLVDEVDEARHMLADLDAWSDDKEDEDDPVEDEEFDEDAIVSGEDRPVGAEGDM